VKTSQFPVSFSATLKEEQEDYLSAQAVGLWMVPLFKIWSLKHCRFLERGACHKLQIYVYVCVLQTYINITYFSVQKV
jgi:hypothetical protein